MRNLAEPSQSILSVHPDIQNLLWIGDGKYKNYIPIPAKETIIMGSGIKILISFSSDEEPSLLYLSLPIANVTGNVERPPYYPTYKSLTPQQKGVYWKLLGNPYDNSIDIGYVFILYYGLERYLLTDQYEKAIDVILKLRDVHTNNSFQMYSANAVILTCLQRQRPDLVQKFIASLDKEHEFSFSSGEYLLCKYALGIPLIAEEVMRMAKSFEFTKNNYIKNYPELFIRALTTVIRQKYNGNSIPWSELLTEVDFDKLESEVTPIFANVSIRNREIKIPSILSSFKLRKKLYDLLDTAHEEVKKQLADMKKAGETIPSASKATEKDKKKEILSFDNVLEKELLKTFKTAKENSLDQHFASISLQDFYYKYRSVDQIYLEKCIEYCKDDISRLPEIQKVYVEEEKKKIASHTWLTPQEVKKQISEITIFRGNIPAFKRLAIIYEKEKDYEKAIDICNQAISYYNATDVPSQVEEFAERRQKLVSKLK